MSVGRKHLIIPNPGFPLSWWGLAGVIRIGCKHDGDASKSHVELYGKQVTNNNHLIIPNPGFPLSWWGLAKMAS